MNALFIIANPIGNLQDLSFRAFEILKQVDLICAKTQGLQGSYWIITKLKKVR
jgi:16S rRNA C1402 (ribose-2'-O) methylase RsmI